jgi:Flp pilus assembly protein TadB
MKTFATDRAREARIITTALVTVCAAGCTAAVVPGAEHVITVGVLALAGLAVAVLLARLTVRWVRERREDRTDAVTAARWRATHAPHLLDDQDRAVLNVRVVA